MFEALLGETICNTPAAYSKIGIRPRTRADNRHCTQFYLPLPILFSGFETLDPIPYTLYPKKDPNLSLFRRSGLSNTSRKNIARFHVMCALFRIAAPMGTSGLRAGSPSRANGHIPRAPLPHDACAYFRRRLALRS